MPIPFIVWAGVAISGVAATGWAAREIGDASESTAKLAKWVVIGGTAYASYRALKSAGALK